MRHYIYEVVENITGEFYFGVRSCDCDPKDDTYMGSMTTWKPNKENLIKRTIIEYPTREAAQKAENTIIKFYIDKKKFPLNRNYYIPFIGYHLLGYKFTDEQRKHVSDSCLGELNGFFNKKHSQESKNKMSDIAKKNMTAERKELLGFLNKGRVQSQNEKDKRAESIHKTVSEREDYVSPLSGRKRPDGVVEKFKRTMALKKSLGIKPKSRPKGIKYKKHREKSPEEREVARLNRIEGWKCRKLKQTGNFYY